MVLLEFENSNSKQGANSDFPLNQKLSETDLKALFDELAAVEEQLKPFVHELEELGL